MKKMIAFALVALLALPVAATAQVMYVQGAPLGGTPGPVFDIGQGAQFNLAVVLEAGSESSAAEFVMTELLVVAPGVFKLNTTKINNTQLDLGNNAVGEYLMAYAGCVASGPQEIVRINYGDFGGVIGSDVVLQIRGFEPGDSQPSSFNGQMGYITPTDDGIVLSPAVGAALMSLSTVIVAVNARLLKMPGD